MFVIWKKLYLDFSVSFQSCQFDHKQYKSDTEVNVSYLRCTYPFIKHIKKLEVINKRQIWSCASLNTLELVKRIWYCIHIEITISFSQFELYVLILFLFFIKETGRKAKQVKIFEKKINYKAKLRKSQTSGLQTRKSNYCLELRFMFLSIENLAYSNFSMEDRDLK